MIDMIKLMTDDLDHEEELESYSASESAFMRGYNAAC